MINAKRKGVIYSAKGLSSSKVYIGQTIKTLEARKHEHEKNSQNQKHLAFNTKFYNALHSEEFVWKVLKSEINEDLLDKEEIQFIELYDSYRNGLNSTIGGDGSRGFKHTEAFRQKLSQRMQTSNPMKNRPGELHNRFGSSHSEAWKRLQSVRLKNNNPMRGRHEDHPQAKLDFEKAEEIRSKIATGLSRKKLAKEFNVGLSTINRVVNNKIWIKEYRDND